MGFPLPPNVPVLMVSLPSQSLVQACWAGRLPDVPPSTAFWASARDAPWLASAGFAEYAPPNTVAPPPEPRWTAHGSPGAGAGTSNCSH
jgi:hypothetical protein